MNTLTLPAGKGGGNTTGDVKPTAAFSFNDYLENDVIAASLQGDWTDVSFLLDALKEQGLVIHTLDELNSFMEKNPQLFREDDGSPEFPSVARHWLSYLKEALPPQPLPHSPVQLTLQPAATRPASSCPPSSLRVR